MDVNCKVRGDPHTDVTMFHGSVSGIELVLYLTLCGLVMSPAACDSGAAATSTDGSNDGIGIDSRSDRGSDSGNDSGGRDAAAEADVAGKADGGDRDGGPDGEVIATGPVAQCRQIVTTICNRAATTCGNAIDPIDEATCDRLSPISLGCDRAVTSLAACVADVLVETCDELIPPGGALTLPDSCIDPLQQIPPSVPQAKCRTLLHTTCERDMRCNLSTETADDCAARLEATQVDCSLAVDLSATYDLCLQELGTTPCPAAGAPSDPASCTAVVVLAK
ncbi:MAG TPA: hypothetical protein VGL59_09450 [Polyangia bacterium]|jgi:hypothetical protein